MQPLLGQCLPLIAEYNSILITLFLAGLIGGFTHCSGMCGPFVLAQTKPKKHIINTLHLPYHLGRMTTYILLGICASIASAQIIGTPLQKGIAVTLLICAGMLFIISAIPAIKRSLYHQRSHSISNWGKYISALTRPLWHHTHPASHYLLGVMLGFIPCGLIYAALMITATITNPFAAAMGMAAFTLGTLPALFMVGLGSQYAYRHWPTGLQYIMRITLIWNGINLLIIAGNII